MSLFLNNLRKYPYETCVITGLFFYTLFYLTPSSYGHALSLLGMNGDGLIFGTPRPVRSDEWAVWTPYLQSLINNGFSRYNEFSLYHEDFRNFNALPILDWALVFKPQFWSFFIMEPAQAFSFSHGVFIAAFLIGWKQLPEKLMGHYPYASPSVFILFSLTLFFSGFVQTWWTTLGPVIAFFPWLMIVLLNWKKNTIGYYVLLSYIAAVWLLSHTYPPIIISCAYLGICLVYAFQPQFFYNPKRISLTLIAFLLAIGGVAFYFQEVIAIMMGTVYPGERISSGGEVDSYLWLSSFIPYITHSYLESINKALNICEIGAVSSLLPLIAICFVRYRDFTYKGSKEIRILLLCTLFFSLWMLVPIPAFIGKPLLLTMIPGRRLLFALGITVNFIALILLLKHEIYLTLKRVILFSILILFAWNLQTLSAWSIGPFEKSALELLALPLLWLLFLRLQKNKINPINTRSYLVFTAFLINALYFSSFNPLQSAVPIFNAANSSAVAKLKKQQAQDPRGWLISPYDHGAVFNGLGLKSFSHVLIQPQLAFFRKLFPEIPDKEFRHIFNRYAHIQLYNGSIIYSPSLDVILIPLKRVQAEKLNANRLILYKMNELNNPLPGGALDVITMANDKLILLGWFMSSQPHYATNLDHLHIESFSSLSRPDVVKAVNDVSLINSGFKITLHLSEKNKETIAKEGFCLASVSDRYGARIPVRSKQDSDLDCKK